MAEKQVTPRENWFNRNPKKTLLLVTLIVIFLGLFATEKGLGYINKKKGINLDTEPRYIRLREFRPLTRVILDFPLDHRRFTDDAAVLTKKYKISVDDDGFIMPSKRHKQPDVSLVFLGGSTTATIYADEENRFPYLVGKLLEKDTGKKINAYNGGYPGNNSLHAIDILINKVMPIQPQIVVFMENVNDLSTLAHYGSYWPKVSTRAPIETLKKHKLVGKLLKETFIPNLNKAWKDFKTSFFRGEEEDEFAASRGKKLKVDKGRFVREFEMNLQTLVYLCQVRGITPVLMTQANRFTADPDVAVRGWAERFEQRNGISYPQYKEIYDAMMDTIRSVARKNQIQLIDLAREIPRTKEFMYDNVHFNDAGSKLAAQIIARELKPLMDSRQQTSQEKGVE